MSNEGYGGPGGASRPQQIPHPRSVVQHPHQNSPIIQRRRGYTDYPGSTSAQDSQYYTPADAAVEVRRPRGTDSPRPTRSSWPRNPPLESHFEEQQTYVKQSHRVIMPAIGQNEEGHSMNPNAQQVPNQSHQVPNQQVHTPHQVPNQVQHDGTHTNIGAAETRTEENLVPQTDRIVTAIISLAPPKKKIMKEHDSYHQAIPGEEARRRLELFGAHCYLTRFSEELNCYILSVFQIQTPKNTMKHFEIEILDSGKNRIKGKEGDDEEFEDVAGLIAYYEQNRIDPSLRTIGQKCTEEGYKAAQKRKEKKCTIL